jgi:hypothetical protein
MDFNRPQLDTPLDYVFYLTVASNVFSCIGIAGVLNQQHELVSAFVYSAAQLVTVLHFLVDAMSGFAIKYERRGKLLGHKRAIAGAAHVHTKSTSLGSHLLPLPPRVHACVVCSALECCQLPDSAGVQRC